MKQKKSIIRFKLNLRKFFVKFIRKVFFFFFFLPPIFYLFHFSNDSSLKKFNLNFCPLCDVSKNGNLSR